MFWVETLMGINKDDLNNYVVELITVRDIENLFCKGIDNAFL